MFPTSSVRLWLCFPWLALGACADLTQPGAGAPPLAPEPAPEAAASAEPAPSPTPPTPSPTPAPQDEEKIGASHVLIMYKGSMRAEPSITRTKEEAKTRAELVAARAKKGDDFAALAREFSDEPGAKTKAGNLGKFGKNAMVAPFSAAAFALKPGQISSIVETNFGFHVIKRTE